MTAVGARLVLLIAAARAWRWGAVLGRVALGALGLVLLGVIGSSARAKNILAPESPPPTDAGLVVAAGSATAAGSRLPLPAATPRTGGPVSTLAGSSVATAATPAVVTPVEPPEVHEVSGTPAAPEAARGRATPDDPVYLNQATLSDLHRLPGVGPKRAEAILTLRNRLGHFRQVEDLLKVKGIGRSSLRKLRPLVRLDPPPAKSLDGGNADAHG